MLLSTAPFKTFWSEIYSAKAAPNLHRVGDEGPAAGAPREHQAARKDPHIPLLASEGGVCDPSSPQLTQLPVVLMW